MFYWIGLRYTSSRVAALSLFLPVTLHSHHSGWLPSELSPSHTNLSFSSWSHSPWCSFPPCITSSVSLPSLSLSQPEHELMDEGAQIESRLFWFIQNQYLPGYSCRLHLLVRKKNHKWKEDVFNLNVSFLLLSTKVWQFSASVSY